MSASGKNGHMKAPLTLLAVFVSAFAFGQTPQSWPTLKLNNGKEYKDVKVSAVEPGGLKVMHAAGFARIPYEQLPKEIQAQFTFDPAKAAEQRAGEAAMREKAANDARAAEAKKQQAAAEMAELAKLEWVYVVLKIDEVTPDGLICYRHTKGGVVGSAARAINSITGGSDVIASETDYSTPLFVEGVKGKWAEGDVIEGNAARQGVKKLGNRTYQRWISKPDGLPEK